MIDKEKVRQDLYKAVNAEWEEQAEIPADKVRAGGFSKLTDESEKLLMADVKKLANGEIETENAYEDEFLKYYELATDFSRRDDEGSQPVQDYIQQVESLESIGDLQNFAVVWTKNGFDFPFRAVVTTDLNNTDMQIMHLITPGLILPDKTYYAEDNKSGKKLMEIFKLSNKSLLTLFGYTDIEANKIVDRAVEYDAKMVPLVRSSEEDADVSKSNNIRDIDEIDRYLSNFSFKTFLNDLVGEEVDKANVEQPYYFENLQSLFDESLMPQIKSWLILKLARKVSSYLSEDIRQQAGVYDLAVTGRPELHSQEKAAYYLAKNQFSQVLGNYYGRNYFGPEAREDVRHMVENMIDVYKDRLDANEWLSRETAEKAIEKLDHLEVFVGYPDYYPREYEHLLGEVDTNKSLFANTLHLDRILIDYSFDQWHEETDRTRWGMPADLVNAYYSPLNNQICFPAGILQAPFYDLEQGDSKNYGGIGAVMAHEISHGFDNNGAKFDAKGNYHNWWKEEDFEVFDKKAQDVIEQYDGLETPYGEVNGKLTVSENIADLGGLTCALESLKREDDYDLVEFFTNWARVWRQKARPEYAELLLSIDVHAPNYWRANMVPQNLDDFHETFGTKEGDNMYLPKEDRIVIW